jgi:type II secretory pathway predicted ATPase ExeA/chromosome segregation ATPase
MYLDHFGLRLLPFEDRADPQFHFATPESEETIASLEYAVRYGHRPAIVAGEAGVGKTMMIRALLQRLHSTEHAVVVTVPTGDGRHIIREAAKAFGLVFSGQPTTRRCLARLRRHLTQNAREDHNAVAVFDQAEHLTAEEMLKAVALSELQLGDRRLVSVILVGQPQMLSTLAEPEFARFRQQAFAETTLTGLSSSQTAEYIRKRLTVAGAANPDIFSADAVVRICRHTGGNPRLINQLANACLVAAYGAGAETIDDDIALEATQRTKAAEPRRATHEPHVIRQRDKVARTITAFQMEEPAIRTSASTTPHEPAHDDDMDDALDHDASLDAGERHHAPAPVRSGRPAGGPASGRRLSDAAARLTMMSGSADAVVAADRLESLLRRADRARAMQDANLGHYGALEEHLETLTRNAERLMDVLPGAVQRASEVLTDMSSRGEAVIERFERRMEELQRRADSIAAVAADACGHDAQLDEACTRATRIESRMTEFAEELLDKMERSQEKVTLLMTALESGDRTHANLQILSREVAALVEGSTAELDRRQAALREVTDRADHVVESCSASSVAIAELDREKARLESQIIELRQQLADAQTEAGAVGESAAEQRRKAAEELKEIENQAGRFVQTARREQEEARAIAEQVSRLSADLVGRTSEAEDTAHALGELTRQTSAAMDEFRVAVGQMETMQRTSHTMLVDIGAACEKATSMARQIETGQRVIEGLEGAQASAARSVDALHAVVRDANTMKDATTAMLGDMEQKTAQIGSHQAAATSLLHQLAEANRTGQSTLRGLDAVAERVGDEVRHINAQLSAWQSSMTSAGVVTQRLDDAVQNGAVLVDDVRRMIDRLDGAHGATSAELQQVGAACEQLRTLHAEAQQRAAVLEGLVQQTAGAARQDAELTERLAQADAATRQIAAALADSDARLAAFTAAGVGADDLAARLTGARARAIQAVERLDAAMSDSHGIVERIQQSAQAAAHVTEQAQNMVGAINALRGDVDDRVDSLERHTNEAAAAQGQLERIVTDIWSMSTDMDERLERMTKEQNKAESVLTRITESAETLGTISAEIGSLVGTAQQRSTALEHAMAGADELTARLAHFAALAQTAEAAEPRLGATVAAADALGSRLDTAIVEARAHQQSADEIRGLMTDGRKLTDQLKAERVTAETVLRALDDIGRQAERIAAEVQERTTELNDRVERGEDVVRRIDEQADTVVAGERLMRELVAQAEQLAAQVRGLDSRAAKLDEKIERAVAAPMQAVEAAQTQAAKLESVCAAVKKVFAQLSKSALEANANSASFDRASREATERLAQLQAETQRAADTLQEWVAEAARAQERLARTLASAPTIAQTHPTGSMQSLAKAAEPIGTIVSKPAGRVGRPTRPVVEDVDDHDDAEDSTSAAFAAVGAAAARPKTRAEEIARLIADARRSDVKRS